MPWQGFRGFDATQRAVEARSGPLPVGTAPVVCVASGPGA